MKRRALLVITALITVVLLVTVSATAKKPTEWTYFAYGTINDYNDAPSSTIIDGYWNLKIQGNQIWLQVNYIEKNLIEAVENSPDGSVDLFEFSYMGQPMAFIEGEDTLDIFAVMKVDKT